MEKIGEDCLMSAEIGSSSTPHYREVSGTTINYNYVNIVKSS
jgi:hypothetical protein